MKDLLEFIENHYVSLYVLFFCTLAVKVRIFPKKKNNEHQNIGAYYELKRN